MDTSNLTGILGVRFAHRHIWILRRVRWLLHRKRLWTWRDAQTIFEEEICLRVHDCQMPWATKRKPSKTASSSNPSGSLPLIFTLRRTYVSSRFGQAFRVVLLEELQKFLTYKTSQIPRSRSVGRAYAAVNQAQISGTLRSKLSLRDRALPEYPAYALDWTRQITKLVQLAEREDSGDRRYPHRSPISHSAAVAPPRSNISEPRSGKYRLARSRKWR